MSGGGGHSMMVMCGRLLRAWSVVGAIAVVQPYDGQFIYLTVVSAVMR